MDSLLPNRGGLLVQICVWEGAIDVISASVHTKFFRYISLFIAFNFRIRFLKNPVNR